MSSKDSQLPASLQRTQARFRQWRRRRAPGSRIPARLWEAAVKMASDFGIAQTTVALGLDYYSLKKRVAQHRSSGGPSLDEVQDVPVFLELAAGMPPGAGEFLVEWEDAGGSKMRVHLKGCGTPDLDALSRSFWRRNQ